jgi:hypothetical protein
MRFYEWRLAIQSFGVLVQALKSRRLLVLLTILAVSVLWQCMSLR